MFAPNVRNEHSITLAVPADAAFMLFTPKGEELWIDHWRPHYLHPADGRTAEGMAFATGEGPEYTLWQLIVFDRVQRRSVYARTTPVLRLGTVTVEVEPIDSVSSRVSVRYDMTALAGDDAALAGYRNPQFAAMIDGWGASIQRLLPGLIGRIQH